MTLTEKLTVGEVAAASLDAVRILENHGIDYCCGGKRELGEVCRERGLDFTALHRELESAMHKKNLQNADWRTAPLGDLIRHIVAAHHEYLRRELPRLHERLKRVLAAHGGKDSGTLEEMSRIFLDMRDELEAHMHREEAVLFPCIERLESAVTRGLPPPPFPFGSIGHPIAIMESEHDSAGGALRRLREVTSDYRLPDYACATYRALFDGLRELENDLHRHIHLENNILFPRAAGLEDRRG